MRYYWDLIRHFFVSNSRHGTHSPFVYGLASHVIYHVSRVQPHTIAVPSDFNPKYRNLLLAILTYMHVEELDYLGQSGQAEALFADLRSNTVDEITEAVRQGKVIIVHEPFRSRKTKWIWQQLVQSTDVVVSINLFHFGLLMYRTEQRKENFRLRYPFWK
ncbi:hypothetical protein FXV77_11020 [Sphingobacterium phlebotomi]|uniref:Uncharacterized protein n=1 Tax=Sphingobacterium phlebotomi TaxID=2605433 RepID=A0A5D4H564_9SPHI|nr:hypothetical protein [Sphingobacterium phlebotomi]TYR35966.1 hypothetical protein FXV77_11020 [Sphingobacterium phlebotomi]